jgi:hypothetical protein
VRAGFSALAVASPAGVFSSMQAGSAFPLIPASPQKRMRLCRRV